MRAIGYDDYRDFTVGNDGDCGGDDACNGPLNDDTSYRVALGTCSQGGCSVRPYGVTAAKTGSFQ